MGGNPGADGMTCSIQMPDTERVPNLRAVEAVLVYSQIEGRRNWEQLIRTTLQEQYTCSAGQLTLIVQMCLYALGNDRLPVCVMDKFREAQRFNSVSVLK